MRALFLKDDVQGPIACAWMFQQVRNNRPNVFLLGIPNCGFFSGLLGGTWPCPNVTFSHNCRHKIFQTTALYKSFGNFLTKGFIKAVF